MSDLLNSAAVGSKGGKEAGEILGAYLATQPALVLNHTLDAMPSIKPKAAAPMAPGGGSSGGSTFASSSSDAIVSEYEIFKNGRDALAFFFFHHPVTDKNPATGPFWFTIENDKIRAGTGANHAVFEDVKSDILDVAKKRGVMMMVEFENQQPVRCTPCYLADKF